MDPHLLDDRLPHERDESAIAEILARAGASKLHELAFKFQYLRQIELLLGVKTYMPARLSAAHETVGADHVAAAPIAHDQMIAIRIELVHVQPPVVGRLQSFIELEIKDFKPEALSLFDLAGLRGDFDFKVGHGLEK